MKRNLSVLLLITLCFLPVLRTGAAAQEQPIAQAETAFSSLGAAGPQCSESELGDLVADAMREITGADFALLPSYLLTGELESGSVFESDLTRVLPQDETLYTAAVSLSELRVLLEQSVSRIVTDESESIITEESSWDGFLQVSGFRWEYDVIAPPGERVTRFVLRNEELEMTSEDEAFTLVSTAALFDGSLGYPVMKAVPTEKTLLSCMREYCAAEELLEKRSVRASVLGTSNYPLIDRMPIAAIAAACILIVLFASIPRLKEKARYSFEPTLKSYKKTKRRN